MKKIVFSFLFMSCYGAELASTISENTPGIAWSILICTLQARETAFQQLFKKLENQIKQANLQDKVEIIYFSDNRENSIGYKRNKLLQKSQGKYTCFIDDDDNINENYIQIIYEKLQENPDCVSLKGIITFDGKNPCPFTHSLTYDHWFKDNNGYYRPPNHLNPIKRDIAIQFIFPETNWHEDRHWSHALVRSGLLKKEVTIEEPLYFYNYTEHKDQMTVYMGQVGQDKFVNERFFKNKKNGVFIDIGAYDGISHSNTYFFEKELGWTGICIEPLAEPFEKLTTMRACICYNCCIAEKEEEEVPFIKVDSIEIIKMLSGMQKNYDPRHFQRLLKDIKRDGGSYEIISVPSKQLGILLHAHSITEIDFLSIDTEGSELEILKSIDFDTYFIHVITVENNFQEEDIRNYLRSQGFMYVTTLGYQDDIFINAKSSYRIN